MKKLLKGRSSSVSPTRSSNASISQPPSKKATVETQTISVASVATQSGTRGRSLRAACLACTDISSLVVVLDCVGLQ